MQRIVFVLLLVFSSSLYSQNEEVKGVIVTFFKGFHAKDSTIIKSVCAENMILQSIAESSKGTQLKNQIPQDFYRSIASIPSTMLFEERLLDYSIQVDGAMAHVWTPYEFYVNNKLSHKGVNAFTLFKDNGLWKIVYLIDTRRK
ncbi:nuclear transport factor 2 family protein [Flavobacterium ammonificans]|jgi:hypothetical protein|uniref:nuclear transport factor 2 family protein n=1 Tax=Flavobacterium ammonificans TaxID=1751056 RepID=UPI001E5AA283|nr:nuclear transport factor 2 family protein [Flavobacterium ammonificans]BDB57241.1 hypothetical protein SHINM13_15370 [Flavobacterium ammonificans]